MLTKVSKPALLRQLFELGVNYSAQLLSFNKILGQMQDAGNTTTLSRYLMLLDQAGLLAGLQKYGRALVNIKASIPKFQVHNMAIFSAEHSETFSQAQIKSEFWGRAVESAAGAFLVNEARSQASLEVYYWREANDEVDYVVKQGSKLLGLEIKSTPLASGGKSLELFRQKFPGAETLLIGGQGMSLEEFFRTPLPSLMDMQ
jgi:predicted AAA+ superfamily ATPase